MEKSTIRARSGFLRMSVFFAVLWSIVLLASCTTKVVVRFPALPGFVPTYTKSGFENHVPEPAEPAGGVVYIQTGLSPDAAVYGPFPVVPGKDLVVTGLPSGTYERLALYYAPVPLATADSSPVGGDKTGDGGKKARLRPVKVTGLPVVASSDGEFWDKTAANGISRGIFGDMGAVALFAKTKVRVIGKTVLGAQLIPLSATVVSPSVNDLPVFGDSAGKVQKRFVKIDRGNASSVYIMLTNMEDRGFVYAGTVSLYGSDGSILDSKTFNKRIPEDLPEALLFKLPETGAAWLYIESITAGDTKLPLFFY